MKSFYSLITRGKVLAVSLSLFLVLCLCGCPNANPVGKNYPNVPPRTRLSNVPPPWEYVNNDSANITVTQTKNPRLLLNWIGDDADGYVVGYRYRWNYRLSKNEPFQYYPYKIILNLVVEKFALMVETESAEAIPPIYKYFANLVGNNGLSLGQKDSLSRGDSIWVYGYRLYASNPDSIRLQTGRRIKYTFPVHENPNSGTFIFDSQDTMNLHTFEVSAIDNKGATSTVYAKVSFETPQVVPPHTIVRSGPLDTALVLMNRTPTFNGLQFSFQGIDPNSRTIDYRWVVDKDQWLARTGKIPWSDFSPAEYAYITAKDLPDPFAVSHTFYVQARNEFGSIDTIGITRNEGGTITDTAWYNFKTLYPQFVRPDLPHSEKILIINNNFDNYYVSPAHPSPQMVDDFYTNILNGLGKPDSIISYWRVEKNPPDGRGFPPRSEVAKYSTVIFTADGVNEYYLNGQPLDGARLDILKDYCYVGGDLIMSGWQLSSDFNMTRVQEFFDNIIHVDMSRCSIVKYGGMFNNDRFDTLSRAVGVDRYPTLLIDSSRADSAWIGGLSKMYHNPPVGFGEIIQKMDVKSDAIQNEGAPLSIKYLGITFNCAYFGAPLYYFQRPAVDTTIARVFSDFQLSKERR